MGVLAREYVDLGGFVASGAMPSKTIPLSPPRARGTLSWVLKTPSTYQGFPAAIGLVGALDRISVPVFWLWLNTVEQQAVVVNDGGLEIRIPCGPGGRIITELSWARGSLHASGAAAVLPIRDAPVATIRLSQAEVPGQLSGPAYHFRFEDLRLSD